MALAIPELGTEQLARYDGSCHFCNGEICAGEHYVRQAGEHWGHALCATGYVQTLEAHSDDDNDGATGASEERR